MEQETLRLGTGIYTAPEVAKILKLPKAKVGYWFRRYVKDRLEQITDFKYYFDLGNNRAAVNFFSLIEIYVFYQLKERGVSTQRILRAHKAIADAVSTPYPFAHSNLLVSGGKVLFNFKDEPSIISADKKLQYSIKDVILPFCKKIDFGDDDIAIKYYPLGKRHSVVVNPRNQFGEPTIEGTNILADTIYEMHLGGDSVDFIAKLYNISATQVKDAIEYANVA